MKKLLSSLSTQSLVYFLICGAGIIVFIFLIIIPGQKTSAELEQDIAKLNDYIEEQRILRPVFDSLLKRAKQEKGTDLPETQKVKLARGDVSKVSALLQEIARRHDLEVQDIRTDVSNLMSDTRYMLMRISVMGDFMNFRHFLLGLEAIPAMEQIEEIKITAIEGTREYKLKIWLAQE